MKMKLKIDKDTILAFGLEHVEKFVFGLIVLLVLFMLYSSFGGAERFDRSAKQLDEQVENGRRTLESTPPDSVALVFTDYAKKSSQGRKDIEEGPYATLTLWDRPLFERRSLRDTPPLFGVQKLNGTAGYGAFRNEKSGEVGQRWVVLTGIVPIEQQIAAFLDTLKNSTYYNPQTDTPNYLGYWVERVEVAGPAEAANPDWTKAKKIISNTAISGAKHLWGSYGGKDRDVVSSKYLDPVLSFPLGPIVDKNWGAEATHAPEIPMLKGEDLEKGRGEPAIGPMMPMPMAPIIPAPNIGPSTHRGAGAAAAADTPFGDSSSDEDTKSKKGTKKPQETQDSQSPGYKLFRFFDFTVEPGKSYVYRVRLGLQNPNRDLKSSLLAKAEAATLKVLETKWSEPSAVISVPQDASMLAVSVSPALRANVEASCKILVTKWLNKKGFEGSLEKDKVSRGQLCNYSKEKITIPARLRSRDKSSSDDNQELSVDFQTGMTIVDFRGGKPLTVKRGATAATSVGEILLLNADGSLSVRNELDDLAAYERLSQKEKEEASKSEPTIMGPTPPIMMPTPPIIPPGAGLDAFGEEKDSRKKRPGR